jgi:hypothetical protein
MSGNFYLNVDFHVTFRDLLHAPFEGRHAEDFFALKIRRLQPGANPRTWVPKASTLPLDHGSHLSSTLIQNKRQNYTLSLNACRSGRVAYGHCPSEIVGSNLLGTWDVCLP